MKWRGEFKVGLLLGPVANFIKGGWNSVLTDIGDSKYGRKTRHLLTYVFLK